MNKKIKNIAFIFMVLVLTVVSTLAIKVNAAGEQRGSLTIICHEQKNGNIENSTPIEGVPYEIYKVDESIDTVEQAYHISGLTPTQTAITNSEGKVVFSNLELGRYLVSVNLAYNTNESYGYGVEKYEDFLIDIPMTNVNGVGYSYDVTVEPKVQSIYGNFELNKVDTDNNPLKNVSFKIQYKQKNDVIFSNWHGSANVGDWDFWTDYKNNSEILILTTDENGKITLNNLPRRINGGEVVYRLVETSAPESYIIDNSTISKFCFYINENGEVVTNYNDAIIRTDLEDIDVLSDNCKEYISNVTQQENITSATYVNERVKFTKKVESLTGELKDSVSLGKYNKAKFEIRVSIPKNYKDAVKKDERATMVIMDSLPDGLILDENSIVLQGVKDSNIINIDNPKYIADMNQLGISCESISMNETDNNGIILYDEIIIKFSATLDFNTDEIIGGDGIVNTAKCIYRSKISENGVLEGDSITLEDNAEVHTGALKIEKVDKKDVELKLAGAKFKIATSKENAKAGIFVQDNNSNDIEVITDVNGIADIKGLAYEDNGDDSTYWLVETQAPTYTTTVNGEEVTKSYNLLLNPLEVKVGKTTYDTAVQVKNSKGFTLPETGGIGIILFVIVGISIMTIAVIKSKKEDCSITIK